MSGEDLDALACYELTVQSPRHVVAFLRAVHGQEPTTLREDFCGSAAVGRRWLAEARKAGHDARVVGVDLDAVALERARALAMEAGVSEGLELLLGDATAPTPPGHEREADVAFVGNFSLGYIHARRDLVGYLRRTCLRLRRARRGFGGGVLVCDTYGGASAFRCGGFERQHPGKRGEIIRYAWAHEEADPTTGMVTNSISFRVQVAGRVVKEMPRAFVYRWRLWSIAELREAMAEAGFARSEVYRDHNVAPGEVPRPVASPTELGEDYVVLIAAWA